MRMERVYPYFCPLVSYTSPLRNERPMRLHFLFQLNREAWEKKEREGRRTFQRTKEASVLLLQRLFSFLFPRSALLRDMMKWGPGLKRELPADIPGVLSISKRSQIFFSRSLLSLKQI